MANLANLETQILIVSHDFEKKKAGHEYNPLMGKPGTKMNFIYTSMEKADGVSLKGDESSFLHFLIWTEARIRHTHRRGYRQGCSPSEHTTGSLHMMPLRVRSLQADIKEHGED